jgi:2-succinyl-5-enolpyruvyl-6-hydroxy-3-cyclohexene-1-carboxylate synthase
MSMNRMYSREKNAQIVLSLLKAHGIRKVIASPGTTNMALVASMQNDEFFEIYSSVDERSACYMACGLADESGEAVVLTCTGATASRNYLSGLTEAFYRKLPVLAITSMQMTGKVGHLIPQIIDRSVKPVDTHRVSLELPIVKDSDDWWECESKVNRAILELSKDGGGPVHITLPTRYSRAYDVKELPKCRVVKRFLVGDDLPEIEGKVAVFIGSHRRFTKSLEAALDEFCSANNAVVFCDHTSSYKGSFRVDFSLIASQDNLDLSSFAPDTTVHIGEVSGDYYTVKLVGAKVWRVSEDGELRDTFRKLTNIFQMSELDFFKLYTNESKSSDPDHSYFNECRSFLDEARTNIPPLPLSNIWIASQSAHRLPPNCVMHFGILNSLRSWNYFEIARDVSTMANVGGFGIDGGMSSLVGASLFDTEKLYFLVIGDLAFFYDMNVLGNRHLQNNIRILLINNGKGTEFRQYKHVAGQWGSEADRFIAAAGHFGNKSPDLVRNYVKALDIEYLSASTKEEFSESADMFFSSQERKSPMLLEVFVSSEDEDRALKLISGVAADRLTRFRNGAARINERAKQAVKTLIS